MPLKVQKQGKESSQNIVRRFTQRVRKSGILLQARKKQFKRRPKSRPLAKFSALRREAKRKEYQEMRKMAKPVIR
ncbi:MAG: 30S ribosomal protein S21 [Candidatus Pacebacteria bacterium]|nr:30S ribosomal protein S21 [Candidatus Paceibacterota bacterium]